MKFYAKYSFKQNEDCPSSYILENVEGTEVHGVDFGTYKKGKYLGKKYLRFGEPRSSRMRKYFRYTFEMYPSIPLTSTEELNENKQTFGDARQIGLNDLILFQFADDFSTLDMYFIKDKARNKSEKILNFNSWVEGEKLEQAS